MENFNNVRKRTQAVYSVVNFTIIVSGTRKERGEAGKGRTTKEK